MNRPREWKHYVAGFQIEPAPESAFDALGVWVTAWLISVLPWFVVRRLPHE